LASSTVWKLSARSRIDAAGAIDVWFGQPRNNAGCGNGFDKIGHRPSVAESGRRSGKFHAFHTHLGQPRTAAARMTR
jgi:hypothetical protein